MTTIKNSEDLACLREGGKRLALILKKISKVAVPGAKPEELDTYARELVEAGGDKPAFLNYRAAGSRPYPASLCVSINDEIVHGLPKGKGKVLVVGDIVSLDMGLVHGGLYTDSAVTIAVGSIDDKVKKLLEVTRDALNEGIKAARAGNRVGDIGYAIEKVIKPYNYGIVRELAGHGVGYKVHEDPYVPNYGKKGTGEILKEGMVLAIEPMVNEGTEKIVLDEDGFTYRTADGKRSAHFEHTIAVRHGVAEILTA